MMGLKVSVSLLFCLTLTLIYLAADIRSAVAEPKTPAPANGKPVPLFNSDTKLEPPMIEDTPTALITRVADRGRDRHCAGVDVQSLRSLPRPLL